MEPFRCPHCNSPDTVGYWDRIDVKKMDGVDAIYKRVYPNARKCVDCGSTILDSAAVDRARLKLDSTPREP